MDDLGAPLDGKSKLNTDFEFFEPLHKQGQRATRRFLDAHFDDIGHRATIDLDAPRAGRGGVSLLNLPPLAGQVGTSPSRLSTRTSNNAELASRVRAPGGACSHALRFTPRRPPRKRGGAVSCCVIFLACRRSPLLSAEVGAARLDIVVADITTLAIDAIVNAANTSLLGGGGVDGAIHRAAGPELLAECRTLGGCDTGSAKITRGYRLDGEARDPRGRAGLAGRRQAARTICSPSCYRTALALAAEHALASIAFPAISTGVFRFPADRAARIAVGTVAAEIASAPRGIARVVFCCFSPDVRRAPQERVRRARARVTSVSRRSSTSARRLWSPVAPQDDETRLGRNSARTASVCSPSAGTAP